MSVKIKTTIIITFFLLVTTGVFLSLTPHSKIQAYVYNCGTHVDNGNGTCTATLDDPYEDGNVYLFMGSPSKDTTALEVMTRYTNGPGFSRGYVEWDTSEIPDNSTIEEVFLLYYGTSNDPSTSMIVQLSTHRPSYRTAAALLDDFTNSTVDYVNPWEPALGSPDTGQDLGTQAAADIENQLNDDWFAIGFDMDLPWTIDHTDSIDSEDYSKSLQPPALEITYTPTLYYQVNHLETNLGAKDTLNRDIQVGSAYGVRGTDTVIVKKPSISSKIADFPDVKFVSKDLNWQNLSANTSLDLSKAYAHIENTLEGFSGEFTLYVPRKAGHDHVRVCPQATNFNETTLSCADGFFLYDGQTYNGVTAHKQSGRWKLTGVTGTGGVSFSSADYPELLAGTGQPASNYFFFLFGGLSLAAGFFFLNRTKFKNNLA